MRAITVAVFLATACGGADEVQRPTVTPTTTGIGCSAYPSCVPPGWDCSLCVISPEFGSFTFVCVGCNSGTEERRDAYVDRFGTCTAKSDPTFPTYACQ